MPLLILMFNCFSTTLVRREKQEGGKGGRGGEGVMIECRSSKFGGKGSLRVASNSCLCSLLFLQRLHRNWFLRRYPHRAPNEEFDR